MSETIPNAPATTIPKRIHPCFIGLFNADVGVGGFVKLQGFENGSGCCKYNSEPHPNDYLIKHEWSFSKKKGHRKKKGVTINQKIY